MTKVRVFCLMNKYKILREKGLSCVFNFNDYKLFKAQCAQAFNKAMEIAKKFEELAEPENNDFNDYIF